MHGDHEPSRENAKRRRGGALQNLAEVRVTLANAPATWSATGRVAIGTSRASEIRAVHRLAASVLAHAWGPRTLAGKGKAPQGRRTPKPGGSSGDRGQRASVVE